MSDLNILGIDHVEFYVGNLFQACHFYQHAMGFIPIASTDPKHSEVSVLLKQKNIRLILTASLDPMSSVAEHVYRHGDGVKDIVFSVNNVGVAFDEALKRGAEPISPPTLLEDEGGKMIKSTIATFGDTHHSFVERSVEDKDWFPKFTPYDSVLKDSTIGLESIDHIAFCLEPGSLLRWRDFYTEVLGFVQTHQEDVHNKQGGMNSLVVENRLGNCVFPMIEPTENTQNSQVKRFIDSYGSAGVQHLGFLSKNIAHSVRSLSNNGIEFLSISDRYYTELRSKISAHTLKEDIDSLQALNILVDQDKGGTLFQIFSKVIQTRPTFFIELIQRDNMPHGFGSGNIKALFESLEKEAPIESEKAY